MKITVEFDSEEEFKARIKNVRGGKSSGSDEADTNGGAATGQAPAPLQPPQGGPAFTPPGAVFAPPAAQQFPGPGSAPLPVADPQIAALVGRISARMDAIIASGATKTEDMLAWFRQQVVQGGFPEAGGATLDQIKGAWLAKLSPPALDLIAKTIGTPAV